jgi:DNA-binding transcriptional LysR family regulator
MSRWLSRRAGREFPDSQCGYRLLNLAVWARLRTRTEHFEFESELLLAFAAAGAGIEFVPVPVVPAKRPSRLDPVADTWRWLRWWWSARRWQNPDGLEEPAPAMP